MEKAGFAEVEHTADWALRVWAQDLPGLFEQAARGMYTLSGVELASSPRHTLRIRVRGGDEEAMLVDFLSELLYLAENKNLGFDRFLITLDGNGLEAELLGAEILERKKEIKAVTFHNLKIISRNGGLEAQLVFDV